MTRPTHLVVHGMIRCGKPAGHMALGNWHEATRFTANEKNVTCEACKALGRQDAPQPHPVLQAAAAKVEKALFKDASSGTPVDQLDDADPMTAVVKALDDGTSMGNLSRVIQRAIRARQLN